MSLENERGWGEVHQAGCICPTCNVDYWRFWTADREQQIQAMFKEYEVVEGDTCEDCDLKIEFDRDPSFHSGRSDPKKCIRTHPFCTNHGYKVDWRERCLKAEAQLANTGPSSLGSFPEPHEYQKTDDGVCGLCGLWQHK